MNVSNEIKNAYKSDSQKKVLTISFPELNYTVPTNEVYFESMTLDEAIFDSDSFEVIGCIASQFSVQIRDTKINLKGAHIIASIAIEGINNSDIVLFDGYVDSVDREAQKKMQSITAYDALCSKGGIDVASWYNGLTFPITLANLRNSLFSYIGITQVQTTLPNDAITINKEYTPNTLKAINVIKSICQINGCFGIINREGKFVYRFLNTSGQSETVNYYRSIDYKDYEVNPIDRLTIRHSSDDAGITVGTGDNEYIIQGNMFTYNLEPLTIRTIATNIYPYLANIEYIPFTASNNGYPWIEVGDNCILNYSVYDFDNSTSSQSVYKTVSVVVMHRTMKGIQSLVDEYAAEGKELQREFISDTSADLNALQQTVDELEKHMSTEITTYRNTSVISVNDGNTVDIADMVYQANKGNTIIFHEEVSLDLATSSANALVTVRYYVNGYRLTNHMSEGLLFSGKNILSLMQFWESGEVETNRFQAKLTVTGGNITIQKYMANAYITVKQSEYNDCDIQITREPNKKVYQIGERLDYSGLIVEKVYYDETTPSENITNKCEISPARGTIVTSTDMITVTVTYTETNELGEVKTYIKEFYLDTQYITGISVEHEPNKTEYFVGDELDLTGIKVMADYIDGTTRDVTSSCVFTPNTGYTFASGDTGEIQITYTENTITVNTSTAVSVSALAVEEISIVTEPTKMSYKLGETFDLTGISVECHWNNGTTTDITNQCVYSPANGATITDETAYLTATYTYNNETYTDGKEIELVMFEEIEITTLPTKVNYNVGESLDYTGIVVTGKWSDGSTEVVTSGCTFDPASGTTVTYDTPTTIVVTYVKDGQEYTDTFDIETVVFEGIEITTEPNKTIYWNGETVDYTGMVVTGTWSNGHTEDITSQCTITPAEGSIVTTGSLLITASYISGGQTYIDTLSYEVNPEEPLLKYVAYNVYDSQNLIVIYALKPDEIVEDQLQKLIIPSTYTNEESGKVYDIKLKNN